MLFFSARPKNRDAVFIQLSLPQGSANHNTPPNATQSFNFTKKAKIARVKIMGQLLLT